jgi:hypothetical protein
MAASSTISVSVAICFVRFISLSYISLVYYAATASDSRLLDLIALSFVDTQSQPTRLVPVQHDFEGIPSPAENIVFTRLADRPVWKHTFDSSCK